MALPVEIAAARIIDRLTALLAKAIRRVEGDRGTVQTLEADRSLRLVAHQGFDEPFLAHFHRVQRFDSTVCGRAAGIGCPVLVADIQEDIAFAPHREVAVGAGIRSCLSYPVLNDHRDLLGVFSVHCARVREDWLAEALRPLANEFAALLDELHGLPSEGRSHLEELQALLREAVRLDGADVGNIQILDPATDTLQIAVHHGFREDFLSHFRTVHLFDASSGGRAAGARVPVVIADVRLDLGYKQHLAIARSAGYLSVKSVPIVDSAKCLSGILSTHCREPRSDWDVDATRRLTSRIARMLEGLRGSA